MPTNIGFRRLSTESDSSASSPHSPGSLSSHGQTPIASRHRPLPQDDEEDVLVYSQADLKESDADQSDSESQPHRASPPTSGLPHASPGTRGRGQSLSSFSFSFSTHLLPLGESLEAVRKTGRNLTTASAIALVIGLQVGSGIFSSPGILSQTCGSPGASLIVWVVAGILAWTGASSFAELGAAIPVNGGAQAYLNYSFGGWASYLFIWTSLVALKPGSAAIISLVGSEYLCRIFYHTAFTASPSQSARAIPRPVIKIIAILLLLLVTSVNALSARAGRHAPVILTLLKLLSLVGIIIMALVRLASGDESDNFRPEKVFNGTSHSPGDYALALYSGLWAFDGWDCSNYVAGELQNAAQALPTVIHTSMAIVLVLFLLTNWAYLMVLPLEDVAQSNTIALDFGRKLLGPAGGLVFSLVVAMSCFGALNSSVFATTRLVSVAAEERYIPKAFAHIHKTRETPVNALILQAMMTLIMIGFGDFKSLLGFYGTCAWSFYLLTVGSLLLLRIREPDLERPYQTWLINPVTFSCVAVFLLLMPVFSAPIQSLCAFGFIAAGLPVYYLTTSDFKQDFRLETLRTNWRRFGRRQQVVDANEEDEEPTEGLLNNR